jgi:hypothetical protein
MGKLRIIEVICCRIMRSKVRIIDIIYVLYDHDQGYYHTRITRSI